MMKRCRGKEVTLDYLTHAQESEMSIFSLVVDCIVVASLNRSRSA
jgi:hypothetical protein